MITIDIITLFPEIFQGPFDHSIIKIAQQKKLVKINLHNLRDWAEDKHKSVDDRPYGGGPGMLLMIKPVYNALKALKNKNSHVILLSPQGTPFNQSLAANLSQKKHLILVCGRYEGFDERIRKHLIDQEISIGDFVLSGGELPSMIITEAVVRLIPGTLKKEEATQDESFTNPNLIEHPQYTRPEVFHGWKVPKVLLSGDHAKIKSWQEKNAIKNTTLKRPDLLS